MGRRAHASIDSRPAVDEDRASAGTRGVNVRRSGREVPKHIVLLLVLGTQHKVLDVPVLGLRSVVGHVEHVCNTETLQLLHTLRGLRVAEIEVVQNLDRQRRRKVETKEWMHSVHGREPRRHPVCPILALRLLRHACGSSGNVCRHACGSSGNNLLRHAEAWGTWPSPGLPSRIGAPPF